MIMQEKVYNKRLVYRVTPTGTRYSITKPRSETFTRKEIVFSTIRKISIEDKFNGLVALIDVDRPIPDNNFSYYFRKGDQFYLTIYAAEVDTSKLIIENRSSLLKTVECMQLNESVQFIFKLVREFNSSDVHYDFASSKVLVSLFYPDRERVREKIEKARTRWFIDTVVLDPGHGGKDPGALRRRGRLNEKDIALDIALRLGRLLETKGKLRVVYTRKTDTFLPLWKRTQIANNANGKLFISIHVNACDNRKISGVEFYLLRPGRSEEAIAVAEKAGILPGKIIIDPGIGFGKLVEHNTEIIRRLGEFSSLGRPILIGPSRKSFIGRILDLPVDERLEGTASAVAIAIANGADIVRVHDVRQMVRVARLADAIVRT